MPDAQKPDRLESPEAPWRIILITIGAGIVCTLFCMAALLVFYKTELKGGPAAAIPKPTPAPALETYLFRTSPPPYAHPPQPDGIDAAMAQVAAKGAQAYDPVSGARP